MITMAFISLFKAIFYAVVDIFKGLFPAQFAALGGIITEIMGYPGISFGLYLFNLLVPWAFFSGLYALTLTFIVISKIVYAITGRVGTPPFGSGTSG